MVDEKDAMMRRFGRTEAHFTLAEPLREMPEMLRRFPVTLAEGGRELCYRGGDGSGKGKAQVAELAKALPAIGIDYTAIEMRESTLEDIFVSLLHEPPA
jgi:ABC-2 type transport system ATP-binding protein